MDDLQSQSMDLLIKFSKAIFEANLIYKKKKSLSRLVIGELETKIGLTFY